MMMEGFLAIMKKENISSLYYMNKNMERKTSVTLLGNDKSDSDKLNAINNYIFEDGDYIGIWHEESNTKLKIDGTVKKTQNQ